MQPVSAYIDKLAGRRVRFGISPGSECFVAGPGQGQARNQGDYYPKPEGDAAQHSPGPAPHPNWNRNWIVQWFISRGFHCHFLPIYLEIHTDINFADVRMSMLIFT
jgi:hypothetical protein